MVLFQSYFCSSCTSCYSWKPRLRVQRGKVTGHKLGVFRSAGNGEIVAGAVYSLCQGLLPSAPHLPARNQLWPRAGGAWLGLERQSEAESDSLFFQLACFTA